MDTVNERMKLMAEVVARSNKANLTLRMEPGLKRRASDLFRSMGLDLSTATGMFYRQALAENKIPFEIKGCEDFNDETKRAMAEADAMVVSEGRPFISGKQFIQDILNED